MLSLHDCRLIASRLKECAITSYPEWKKTKTHPTTPKKNGNYCEVNNRSPPSGEDVAMYQYRFGYDEAFVGIYITMMHPAAAPLRRLLESHKKAIEEQCEVEPEWEPPKRQIRFGIVSHSESNGLALRHFDGQLVEQLVTDMWNFQQATLPLLHQAREAAAERAAFDLKKRAKGKRAVR